jgi:hypothetical protein
MGFRRMHYWDNGKTCVGSKIKTIEYPFKNQLSIIPNLSQVLKPQTIAYIFIKW